MQVLPILILAVTDSGGFFNDKLTQDLITEGNQIADFVGGEFKMTTANFQQQSMLISNILCSFSIPFSNVAGSVMRVFDYFPRNMYPGQNICIVFK